MYDNFVHATNDASHYTKPPNMFVPTVDTLVLLLLLAYSQLRMTYRGINSHHPWRLSIDEDRRTLALHLCQTNLTWPAGRRPCDTLRDMLQSDHVKCTTSFLIVFDRFICVIDQTKRNLRIAAVYSAVNVYTVWSHSARWSSYVLYSAWLSSHLHPRRQSHVQRRGFVGRFVEEIREPVTSRLLGRAGANLCLYNPSYRHDAINQHS